MYWASAASWSSGRPRGTSWSTATPRRAWCLNIGTEMYGVRRGADVTPTTGVVICPSSLHDQGSGRAHDGLARERGGDPQTAVVLTGRGCGPARPGVELGRVLADEGHVPVARVVVAVRG